MKLVVALLQLAVAALVAATAATQDPVEQLTELAAKGNGVVKLDAKTFDLITSPSRTWSASVQLTALDPRRRCGPCKEFEPSWKAVAKAWSTVPKGHRDTHFFATLDFDDAQIVFQKLGLASAPVVLVYPPATGERAPANGNTQPSKYDFSHGFDAGPLAASLSKHTPVEIPYKDPIDWGYYLTIGGVGAIFLVTLRFINPILQSRWTWAFGTILASLVWTSGYMFVRIRNSPFDGGNGNWIAAGYQNQFGQEVQVLAFTYGILASSILMLIMVVPYQKSAGRQRMQVYLWTFVFVIVYSILISLFRVKNRGYPFRLFL